jgi:methionyl-tRNA synthetase
MLLSAGQPAPTTIYVHEFFTVNGQKISKSLGNAIDPLGLVEQLGTDGLRYCLLRELPRTEDTDLTIERLLARYDADLANGLGNLLQRTVSMVVRYRSGVVPACGAPPVGGLGLITIAASIPDRVEAALDAFDFRAALGAIWELVTRANRFVEEAAPWTLAKRAAAGDKEAAEKLDSALYSLAECLRLLARHLAPFLPATADGICRQLGLASTGDAAWGGVPAGTRVAVPTPLFPRAC